MQIDNVDNLLKENIEFDLKDFPNEKLKQIQWIKELALYPKATKFFKSKASRYYTTLLELQKLWVKQKGRCGLCGNKIYFDETTHIDHITPKSVGGKNEIENYQFTCARCNFAKRDLSTKEFLVLCIKVAHKNKYLMSKMETMKILNELYRFENKHESTEKRKVYQEQYIKDLEKNNGKIL